MSSRTYAAERRKLRLVQPWLMAAAHAIGSRCVVHSRPPSAVKRHQSCMTIRPLASHGRELGANRSPVRNASAKRQTAV
jgi:hypothetical protein